MTKARRQFNRLVREIEALQQDLLIENRRLDKLVAAYVSEVHPIEVEIRRLRREVLRQLHARYKALPRRGTSMRNRFLKMLKQQLLDHWAELDHKLDDEFVTLFQEVMKCTPEEFKKREFEKVQTEIDKVFDELGLDEDPLENEDEDDADQDGKRAEINAANPKLDSAPDEGTPPKSGSATHWQQAEEEKRRLAEEMRTKDLSSLYKQLAKLLHPDLEQDPERRLAKEAAMKQLNAAHAARDLHAMLKMEIEWITQEGTDASRLSDEKLLVYNSVLEEQINELDRMIHTAWMHPRFLSLAKFAHPLFGLIGVDPVELREEAIYDFKVLEHCLAVLNRDPDPDELRWLVNRLGPNNRGS